MPKERRRAETLFSDLGRATRRGVRNCPKCGTLNGTRGRACKNKACDLVFRDIGRIDSKISTDACKKLSASDSDSFQVFSVRIRDKGPDYRNFVLLPPLHSNVSQQTDSIIDILPQCYVDACARNPNYQCSHIKAAQSCYSQTENLTIKPSVISSINIPAESKHVLFMLLNQMQDLLIQRCSKSSFAVKCQTTPKHPLGFLHVLFFKVNREDGNTEQKFLCSCRPFKINNRRNYESSCITTAYESQNKYCVHYYACICAFASCASLISEFEYFITQTISQIYPATLLSELHLVPISNGDTQDVEQMDPNHVSVEIMRENLSLLESIASDDTTLQQVHLEGVLSDQIVVTNVGDDALGFGDPSALEVLDETDPQVSSHLTHISEILSHSNQNQQVVCQIFTTPDMQYAGAFTTSEVTQVEGSSQRIRRQTPTSHFKKFREQNRSSASVPISQSDMPTIVSVSSSAPSMLTENGCASPEKYHSLTRHHPIRPKHYSSAVILSLQESNELERRIILANFERWIAGVNERMSCAMNYQFNDPDPLVYYLPQEQFECLKDRIISGWKKKRLSNPTLSITLRERPPTGAFTKHVWKITNIIHILHIFQSTLVPLKLSQFFIQNSNGSFSEWVNPKDEGSKDEVIIPVLYCSTLKVGKLELGAKESTPFIIEWIPDILPESRMGELTIRFQVMRTGPITTDEEMRACNSPIQRLIQQSTAFSLR